MRSLEMFGGLFSFHPETVLFRPGGVNHRVCLCGVPTYASAQSLDFLARTKNSSFPNWKPIVSVRKLFLLPEETGRGFPETNGTAFVQALVMAEEAGIAGSFAQYGRG